MRFWIPTSNAIYEAIKTAALALVLYGFLTSKISVEWKATSDKIAAKTFTNPSELRVLTSEKFTLSPNDVSLVTNIKIPIGVACSKDASLAGNHQKIISYSIYGDNQLYWRWLPDLLKQAQFFYPNWFVRVYTDNKENKILRNLQKQASNLQICDIYNLPAPIDTIVNYPPRIWRYFPLGDPQVDIVNFRDSDSEITEREYNAVQEWLSTTNKSLHVMRDHFFHTTPIMGGMWGARINLQNRKKWLRMRNMIFKYACKYQHNIQLDQYLLRMTVWPFFKSDSISHDSYNCKMFPTSVPFPSQRTDGKYIGYKMINSTKKEFIDHCPIECRPPDHKDWIVC